MDMIELRTAHAADLDADAKAAVRRLLHGGRALRTGHVEGVAVREPAPPGTQRRDHGGPGTGGAVGVPACCVRRQRRGQLPARSAGMAAVAGTLHRPDPGRDPANPDKDGIIYVLPVSVPADLSRERGSLPTANRTIRAAMARTSSRHSLTRERSRPELEPDRVRGPS